MNTPSLPFNRDSLILCCYGNQHAIGGPIEAVTIIANTLANYDNSPGVKVRSCIHESIPEAEAEQIRAELDGYNIANRRDPQVIPTHKTFGYVILTEDELAEAFYHLRHNAITRHGKRAELRRAVKLARGLAANDFNALKRENFLGWNVGRNSFIGDLIAEGTVATVDGNDGGDDSTAWSFTRDIGSSKAARETASAN